MPGRWEELTLGSADALTFTTGPLRSESAVTPYATKHGRGNLGRHEAKAP